MSVYEERMQKSNKNWKFADAYKTVSEVFYVEHFTVLNTGSTIHWYLILE